MRRCRLCWCCIKSQDYAHGAGRQQAAISDPNAARRHGWWDPAYEKEILPESLTPAESLRLGKPMGHAKQVSSHGILVRNIGGPGLDSPGQFGLHDSSGFEMPMSLWGSHRNGSWSLHNFLFLGKQTPENEEQPKVGTCPWNHTCNCPWRKLSMGGGA